MNKTDALDLDKLDALERAATPGPWAMWNAFDLHNMVHVERFGPDVGGGLLSGSNAAPTMSSTKANWELLCTLRNAYPAMSARVRELKDENTRLREVMRDVRSLLQTGVAPANWNMIPQEWAMHRIEKAAHELGHALKDGE